MNILFIQTNIYSNYASGVPRVTYNLGKYFTKEGLNTAYFSFKNTGHIPCKFGKLYKASNKGGGLNNKLNFMDLQECILDFKPRVVINQMPYENKLRLALSKIRHLHEFKLIGCVHNSLFSYKNNVRNIMRNILPHPLNYLMSTTLMSKIPLLFHKIKQNRVLRSMIKIHDILLLYSPANFKELKYFVKLTENERSKIKYMLNPLVNHQKKLPKKQKQFYI